MSKSWLRGLLALAVLAVAGSALASAPATIGTPAPPFALTTYDKRKLKLADLQGKVVVINWWATWCGPCKAEMPMMSAFHRRHKDEGFEIFGVTTEDSVPPFMLKRVSEALSYPLVLRFSGGGYPILNGVPTSYVIDRHGVLRYAKAGSFDAEEFNEIILPLLREPAG
ncbi:MAG: TlpA family protein disulfide reductase [Alphaproteobacteria bacterium]|nr:TlpA family protein disulfide reductase [Alphaproteobacteria bacterium]